MLSCVANLRLVGLPTVDIARVCSLVVHHASGEPETRSFACATAYNLSQEPWVLETLSRVHVDAGEPLSARSGDPPEVARHAGAASMRMRRQRWGWLRRAGCARWLTCAVLLGLLLCAVRSETAAQEEPAARLIAGEEAREETAARTPATNCGAASPQQPQPRPSSRHQDAIAAAQLVRSRLLAARQPLCTGLATRHVVSNPPRAGLLSHSKGEPEPGRISPQSPSISWGGWGGERGGGATVSACQRLSRFSRFEHAGRIQRRGVPLGMGMAGRPAHPPPVSALRPVDVGPRTRSRAKPLI